MNETISNPQYDLAVIGGGPGGYESALKAARLGMKTVLIDRDALGGTCLNRGCIPTKTLLHGAETYRQAAAAFSVPAPETLFPSLADHKDQVVSQLREGIRSLLKTAKVEFIQDHASILAPGLLRVGEQQRSARHILIATGSRPALPPIPGRDLPGVLTSDGLLSCREPIRSLTIIGGGVIGMEFASIYSSLGCSVTVIEAMERILPTMDREFSQNLKMILKKRGVEIETGALVEEIRLQEGGELLCRFRRKEEEREASSQFILIATGRTPCTDGLIAEDAQPRLRSIFSEKGFIRVDDRFETPVPGIYAIGDVTGGIQLAHAAAAQGKWAVSAMCDSPPPGNVLPDLNFIPSCVYTDPEIASVGLTLDEAKKQGLNPRALKYPMSANGKSVLTGQDRGFIKIVVSRDTERILGAQMMCARASDMISFFTEALTCGLTISDLKKTIFPHPTFSEGIGEALWL